MWSLQQKYVIEQWQDFVEAGQSRSSITNLSQDKCFRVNNPGFPWNIIYTNLYLDLLALRNPPKMKPTDTRLCQFLSFVPVENLKDV